VGGDARSEGGAARVSVYGRRFRLCVSGLAIVATALMLAPMVARHGFDSVDATSVLYVLVAASFGVSGAFVWARRSWSAIGALLTAFAIVWAGTFLMTQATSPLVFTLGGVLRNLWYFVFAVILLSFPTGRLASVGDRLIVGVILIAGLPLEIARLLFFEPPGGPANVFLAWPSPHAAHMVGTGQRVLFVGAVAALLALLVKRWVTATDPRRRALLPALAGAPLFVFGAVIAVEGRLPLALLRPLLIAFMAAPIALLVSMHQARLARSAIGDLVVELGSSPAPAALRDALARALRDPSLTLAYWLPQFESWADLEGEALELPGAQNGRTATLVDRDGMHVAALIHDASLDDEPELLAAVGAAAGIALENGRLQVELRARLVELAGSRARVVEASQKERQRLERNLHDGAQQRLVALSLELSLLEKQVAGDEDARVRLEQARQEVAVSLDELRAVARGLHPAVLSGHGLEVALQSIAAQASVPVQLTVLLENRLPEQVEVAAFYVVSESLANIAKHAAATSASINVARSDSVVVIEIVDDGVGGADSERGSGLRGLADRVEALGGKLRVWSPSGGGTRLRVEMPCV